MPYRSRERHETPVFRAAEKEPLRMDCQSMVDTFIREATVQDAAMLIDLRKTVYHETQNLLFEPWEYDNSVRQEKRYIERYIQPSNSCLLVAQYQKSLVGLIGARGGGMSKNAHVAQLFLAVRKSHWQQGIARRLMQSVIKWAPTAGLLRLSLTVATDNTRAHELYRLQGFVEEGLQKAVIRDGEHSFHDEIAMALILPQSTPGN